MDIQIWKKYEYVKNLNVLAYDQIKRQVRSGWTEKQLYELVVKTYMENCSSQVLYEGDFISGPRSWGIEGPATDRIVEKGDTIIVDALCAVDGVYCDTTRTYFCGQPTEEQKKAYKLLCALHEEIVPLLKPGTIAGDIFRYTDGRLREEGYGGLPHHAGHGLRHSWCEAPHLVEESQTILEEDMLVAFEPGIYIPGKFGMRLENNYRVTKDGGIDVFGYTKEMEDFIID